MRNRTFSVNVPNDLQPMSDKWRKKVDSQTTPQGYPVDDGFCCVFCGKYMPDGHKGTLVLLADGGEIVTLGELTEFDLGVFPIGSDCARKYKAAGIPLYKFNESEKIIPA